MYGLESLAELAEDVFEEHEPLEVLFRGSSHDISKSGGGGYEVSFNLPLADKSDMDLSKKGSELYVRVGGYKRNVMLPDSMTRLSATGASFEGDTLKVRLEDA
jgi:arsenite-transporting ATPase